MLCARVLADLHQIAGRLRLAATGASDGTMSNPLPADGHKAIYRLL